MEGVNRENSTTSSSPSNGRLHIAAKLAVVVPPMAVVEGTSVIIVMQPSDFAYYFVGGGF